MDPLEDPNLLVRRASFRKTRSHFSRSTHPNANGNCPRAASQPRVAGHKRGPAEQAGPLAEKSGWWDVGQVCCAASTASWLHARSALPPVMWVPARPSRIQPFGHYRPNADRSGHTRIQAQLMGARTPATGPVPDRPAREPDPMDGFFAHYALPEGRG